MNRSCSSCRFLGINVLASMHGQRHCYRSGHNVEVERSRIWRWFGFDTCGREGRYWEAEDANRPPMPPPTR